ncbi:transglutaminase family protein, partial [Enterococcus hirae]
PALDATWYLDHDHPEVRAFAHDTTSGLDDDVDRAAALFAAVRDEIRYDPYVIDLRPDALRASAALASGRNWCVPKATLLAAA